MLSEDSIEKMIQPIIDRQESINNYVIGVIAKRVEEIGHLLPSDVYKLQRLYRSGSDVKRINEELARLTGLQVKDIKKLIKEVALDSYIDAKPYYDYRHKPFIPLEENIALNRVIQSVSTITANEYVNMSKAQAFMIRDMKNPKRLIPTSIAKNIPISY